jgi:predicted metal-dependent hydrolase
MTISLKQGEPIKVKASLKTPFSKIEGFLLQKEKWIERHMLEFAELAEKFPEKKLVPSETFPFMGEMLRLKFVPTPLKHVFFSRHDHHLHLHLPEPSWNRLSEENIQSFFPKLQKYYQREAEKLIRTRIQIWSSQMKLFPKALKFRNQKTRWGSCTSRGSIQINWRLIGAPIEVIDYILIHELAHLKHMNHSEEFWALVAAYCPDFEQSEKWLKENQSALDFLKTKNS